MTHFSRGGMLVFFSNDTVKLGSFPLALARLRTKEAMENSNLLGHFPIKLGNNIESFGL